MCPCNPKNQNNCIKKDISATENIPCDNPSNGVCIYTDIKSFNEEPVVLVITNDKIEHTYTATIPGINEVNALFTAGGTESGNLIVIFFNIKLQKINVEINPIIIAANNPVAPK